MTENPTSGALLTREQIMERLFTANLDARLFVMPLVSDTQVGIGSLDLRLGTEFILSRRTRFAAIDTLAGPADEAVEQKLNRFRDQLANYQERVRVPLGDGLILHPGEFVLGSTLEYLRFPNDLAAYVIGRSSWGRVGLIIATATMVHPGFTGAITLELANVGDAPLRLYPGINIAQISLHPANPQGVKGGAAHSRYFGTLGPGKTRIADDADWPMIDKLRRQDVEYP